MSLKSQFSTVKIFRNGNSPILSNFKNPPVKRKFNQCNANNLKVVMVMFNLSQEFCPFAKYHFLANFPSS